MLSVAPKIGGETSDPLQTFDHHRLSIPPSLYPSTLGLFATLTRSLNRNPGQRRCILTLHNDLTGESLSSFHVPYVKSSLFPHRLDSYSEPFQHVLLRTGIESSLFFNLAAGGQDEPFKNSEGLWSRFHNSSTKTFDLAIVDNRLFRWGCYDTENLFSLVLDRYDLPSGERTRLRCFENGGIAPNSLPLRCFHYSPTRMILISEGSEDGCFRTRGNVLDVVAEKTTESLFSTTSPRARCWISKRVGDTLSRFPVLAFTNAEEEEDCFYLRCGERDRKSLIEFRLTIPTKTISKIYFTSETEFCVLSKKLPSNILHFDLRKLETNEEGTTNPTTEFHLGRMKMKYRPKVSSSYLVQPHPSLNSLFCVLGDNSKSFISRLDLSRGKLVTLRENHRDSGFYVSSLTVCPDPIPLVRFHSRPERLLIDDADDASLNEKIQEVLENGELLSEPMNYPPFVCIAQCQKQSSKCYFFDGNCHLQETLSFESIIPDESIRSILGEFQPKKTLYWKSHDALVIQLSGKTMSRSILIVMNCSDRSIRFVVDTGPFLEDEEDSDIPGAEFLHPEDDILKRVPNDDDPVGLLSFALVIWIRKGRKLLFFDPITGNLLHETHVGEDEIVLEEFYPESFAADEMTDSLFVVFGKIEDHPCYSSKRRLIEFCCHQEMNGCLLFERQEHVWIDHLDYFESCRPEYRHPLSSVLICTSFVAVQKRHDLVIWLRNAPYSLWWDCRVACDDQVSLLSWKEGRNKNGVSEVSPQCALVKQTDSTTFLQRGSACWETFLPCGWPIPTSWSPANFCPKLYLGVEEESSEIVCYDRHLNKRTILKLEGDWPTANIAAIRIQDEELNFAEVPPKPSSQTRRHSRQVTDSFVGIDTHSFLIEFKKEFEGDNAPSEAEKRQKKNLTIQEQVLEPFERSIAETMLWRWADSEPVVDLRQEFDCFAHSKYFGPKSYRLDTGGNVAWLCMIEYYVMMSSTVRPLMNHIESEEIRKQLFQLKTAKTPTLKSGTKVVNTISKKLSNEEAEALGDSRFVLLELMSRVSLLDSASSVFCQLISSLLDLQDADPFEYGITMDLLSGKMVRREGVRLSIATAEMMDEALWESAVLSHDGSMPKLSMDSILYSRFTYLRSTFWNRTFPLTFRLSSIGKGGRVNLTMRAMARVGRLLGLRGARFGIVHSYPAIGNVSIHWDSSETVSFEMERRSQCIARFPINQLNDRDTVAACQSVAEFVAYCNKYVKYDVQGDRRPDYQNCQTFTLEILRRCMGGGFEGLAPVLREYLTNTLPSLLNEGKSGSSLRRIPIDRISLAGHGFEELFSGIKTAMRASGAKMKISKTGLFRRSHWIDLETSHDAQVLQELLLRKCPDFAMLFPGEWAILVGFGDIEEEPNEKQSIWTSDRMDQVTIQVVNGEYKRRWQLC